MFKIKPETKTKAYEAQQARVKTRTLDLLRRLEAKANEPGADKEFWIDMINETKASSS
jgi:hypothetical protein